MVVVLAVAAALASGPSIARPLTNQQPSNRTVEAGIRELLQQYSAAFGSRDALAVKKVQPSIDIENLKNAFNDMRALEVMIDEIKILSTESTTTRVSCRVTQTLTPKAGSKRTVAVMRVMRLRKQDSGWVIDAFER